MMKTLSLVLLLTTGCATRTWVEPTDQWRSVGEAEQRVEVRGIEDRWFDVTSAPEPDGFSVKEMLRTGPSGEASFSLLPAALQALAYGHTVTLSFVEHGYTEAAYTTDLSVADAGKIVDDWRAQVRLGAKPKLRRAEIRLLSELIEGSADAAMVEALKEIGEATTERMPWE